jgi:high affinity cGMP-specific 3',5'-cyclic phosphodiesterase 9
MRFNDQSVLENMHAALTYELFREQGGLANIFSSIESSREKWSRAREVVCTTILATDMSCHFKLQTEFEKAIEHTKSISATAAQHAAQNKAFILKSKIRITLLKVMVHSADISNPTKDWEVSKEWSERVSKEFFAQGDAERKLGLPVSANMDRDTTNKAKLSLGFIDFIVAPLFTNVVKLLPAGSVAIESMASNREKYSKLYQASLAKNEKDMPDEEKEGMKRRQTMFNNFKRRASMVLRGNEDEEEEDNDVSKPPGL